MNPCTDPLIVYNPVIEAHLIFVGEGRVCEGCQRVSCFFIRHADGALRCFSCDGGRG